jgi:uncharacterized Ntn-hydrolase superfamily protein
MRTRLLPVAALGLLFPVAASATFSIVAFDPDTGEHGVAVQSRAFSVGGGVPWAEAGVGAIATQASTNESFGPRALALLGAGLSAEETLRHLIESDEGSADRQLAIVDAEGRVAAHTGASCLDWAGHVTGVHLSAQGNILAGEAVVGDMVVAFQTTEGELAEKLLAALVAGQAAGGDTRGQQSAALLVVRPSDTYPEYRTRYVDLRVEDHEAPIDELVRVFRLHQASDLVRAHLRYARAFADAGREDDATREYTRIGNALQRALESDSSTASTLNALAWYCATEDMFLEESLEAAKRAAALEPSNAGVLDTLAEVHFRRGEFDDAMITIDRAIELEPEQAYYREQRDRFRKAQH